MGMVRAVGAKRRAVGIRKGCIARIFPPSLDVALPSSSGIFANGNSIGSVHYMTLH
jgi:hypothetical protein